MADNIKNVSVVMAVYNGEKYIEEQIDSVVSQLNDNDELIISVDPSNDNSLEIIKNYADNDNRIMILKGPGKGAISNFENGLLTIRGGYVFLCDQDDVWEKNKIQQCVKRLDEGSLLVVHNFTPTDHLLCNNGVSFLDAGFSSSITRNIVKNKYIGCCMAFHSELLSYVLPFPKDIPMHDQWLGLIASKMGEVSFIPEKLIYYRRHESTVTGNKKTSLLQKIKWRKNVIKNYFFYKKVNK